MTTFQFKEKRLMFLRRDVDKIMTETTSHNKAKGRAAGKSGRKEVSLSKGRRLDALSSTGKTATEIERSGDMRSLKAAASRLKSSGAPRKVLQVPQSDMSKARQAMRSKKVKGSVKNMTGTKRSSV